MLNGIKTKLISSQGVKQTGIVSVGNIAAAGLSAISLIIISRLLGPSLFGEFSAGFALIMILNKLNNAGFAVAIQKLVGGTKNYTDASEYISIALKYRLIITGLLFIILLPLSGKITEILNFSNPYIAPLSIVLGISVVYYELFQTVFLSLHRFTDAIIINVIQATVKLTAAFSAFLLGSGNLLPLYTIYIAAPIVPLFFVKQMLPKSVIINLKKITTTAEKEMTSIAKHSILLVLSIAVIDNIGILFVQSKLTSYETGLLGGVGRISLMFTLLAVSLQQVLFPRVARYKELSDLLSFFKKAVVISVASIGAFLFFIPLIKPLILLSIGPEYLQGANILLILLSSVFIFIASVPFTALFYSFNYPKYFSISGFIQIVITVAGNLLLVDKYGLVGTAWTQVLTRVAVLVFTVVLAIIFLKKEKNEQHIS